MKFSNPRFRHGGYAALATGMVIALVIAVNILVDRIPADLDLTRQKLFTLSDQSIRILQNLDQKVTIYGLFEAGKEPEFIDEILQKYADASKRVQLRYVDPFRNPGFVDKYGKGDAPPGANSIIVEMGDKFRIMSQFDLFRYGAPPEANPLAARRAESLKAEQKLTGAILYLEGEKTPVVYLLQGHLENEVPYELREQLEEENYTFSDLNLMSAGAVPEDADLLLAVGPRRDLTDREETLIREFLLERGGRALFMMDIVPADTQLPHFGSILRSYGVRLERALLIEEDPQFHLPQFPIGLIPKIEVHSITADLITHDLAVLFPRSQAIGVLPVKRRTVSVQPLLTTSARSWGKVALNDPSTVPAPEDPRGPFSVAVAVTDSGEGEAAESRIVVTASSFFLYPERGIGLPLKGPGNPDLFFNTVSWLYGREETISIRPKSLLEFPLRMNQLQFFLFAAVSVILIPMLVLIAGLVIWLRRRHL